MGSDLRMFGADIEAMLALYAASRGIVLTPGSSVTFGREDDTPERQGRGLYIELRDVEFGVAPSSTPASSDDEDEEETPPPPVAAPARRPKRRKGAPGAPVVPATGPRKVVMVDAAAFVPGQLEETAPVAMDASRFAAGPPPPSDGKPVLPPQIRRFRPGGEERGETVEERFRVEAITGLEPDTGRVEPGGRMRDLAPDP